MAKRPFLTPLALSVAALLGTTPGPADAAVSNEIETIPSVQIASTTVVTAGSDLVLERSSAAEIKTAYHRSHYSHRSHLSHFSHRSHFSGY